MKNCIFASILLISLQTQAASQVNYLNIDGDAVHFSTNEAKPASNPSCAVAETNDRYAVSLQSEAGRAMYSLLITAMASKQAVTIETAQDCIDVDGLERAKSVSIVPNIDDVKNTANSSGLSLYHSDGVTKIGKITLVQSDTSLLYVEGEASTRLKTYKLNSWVYDIYYTNDNCTGSSASPYNGNEAFNFELINGDSNFGSTGTRVNLTVRSHLSHTGKCIPYSSPASRNGVYKVDFSFSDPLCGQSLCIIK
jgi:hypothetical protein